MSGTRAAVRTLSAQGHGNSERWIPLHKEDASDQASSTLGRPAEGPSLRCSRLKGELCKAEIEDQTVMFSALGAMRSLLEPVALVAMGPEQPQSQCSQGRISGFQ